MTDMRLALLRMQRRKGRPRRMHALLQRQRPTGSLPGSGLEVPKLYEQLRIQHRIGKMRKSLEA